MKLSEIVTLESNDGDSGDHEFRGDFTSEQPADITDDIGSAAEVQDALTELEQDDREIESADVAIDTAVDAIEQIDESVELVKAQEETGEPVSDLQIQTLEITHESIMRHLGLETGKFPTMESFKGSSRGQRLISTMEASAGDILEKLKNLIKSTINSVSDFILNLVRNSWILNKYKDYLKKKVAGLGSSAKPKAEEMQVSAKAMSVHGKASFDSVGVFANTASELLKGATAAVDKLAATNFKFRDIDSTIHINDYITGGVMPITGGRELGGNGFSSLGDNNIVAVEQKEVAAAAKVLSVSEMNSAISAADKIITQLKAFDAANGKIKRFASNIAQYFTQSAQGLAGVVSHDSREKFVELGYIRGMRIVLSKVVGKLPLEAFKNAKAILDYVRNSLKQYEGGKDVKDQPAATA